MLYNPSPGTCHGFMVNHSGRIFVLQRYKLVKLTTCIYLDTNIFA